jgi:hypothetical protein
MGNGGLWGGAMGGGDLGHANGDGGAASARDRQRAAANVRLAEVAAAQAAAFEEEARAPAEEELPWDTVRRNAAKQRARLLGRECGVQAALEGMREQSAALWERAQEQNDAAADRRRAQAMPHELRCMEETVSALEAELLQLTVRRREIEREIVSQKRAGKGYR